MYNLFINITKDGGNKMLISIIFAVITSYIVYKCFESYGFKTTCFIVFVLNLIRSFIQNGFNHFMLGLVIVLLVSLITTAIDYFIFLKTNSFTGYIVVSLVVGILIVLIPSLIIASLSDNAILSAV